MSLHNLLRVAFIFLFYSSHLIAYDTLSTSQIYPGCYYYQISDTGMPVMIYMIKIDLTNPKIRVSLEIAHDSLNLGGERTSDLVKRKAGNGQKVIAAVNADFFGDYPMQAQNSMIRDGRIIKATNLNRTQIVFNDSMQPTIGMFRFEGYLKVNFESIVIDAVNSQDSSLSNIVHTNDWTGQIPNYNNKLSLLYEYDGRLEQNVIERFYNPKRISKNDTIDLKANRVLVQVDTTKYDFSFSEDQQVGVKFIFNGLDSPVSAMTAGLPGLFTEGTIPGTFLGKEGMTSKRFVDKNPRTAIGYNEQKTVLYIVAVDGRQKDYSMGMTLIELAVFMKNIGCYDALNFDGGGSTTMVVGEELVNSPSDFTGERAVYNCLVIYADE